MGNPDSIANHRVDSGVSEEEEEIDDTNSTRLIVKPNAPKVADILRGFGDIGEDVIDRIIAEDVNNRDLPALTVEDLELLGVQSSGIRDTFVLEFANTKIKDEHFESFIEKLDVAKYKESVYKNTAKQMLAIQSALEVLNLSLKEYPVTSNDLIEDDVYVSTITLKAIEEMKTVVQEMTDPKIQESASCKRLITNNWKYLLSAAALGLAIYKFTAK